MLNEHFLIIKILQGQILTFYIGTRNSDTLNRVWRWKQHTWNFAQFFLEYYCGSSFWWVFFLGGGGVWFFLSAFKKILERQMLEEFLLSSRNWALSCDVAWGWHMLKMSEVKNETKPPTFLFHAHNLDFCSTYHCFFHIELNKINFRIFKLLINFLKNTVFLCKTNKTTLQYWNHSGLRHRPLTLEWFKIHKSIHGLWYSSMWITCEGWWKNAPSSVNSGFFPGCRAILEWKSCF